MPRAQITPVYPSAFSFSTMEGEISSKPRGYSVEGMMIVESLEPSVTS